MKRSTIGEKVKEEGKQPKAWWYLSFAEATSDSTGGKWLGANVLFDHGVLHAIQQSHRRGINPGGSFIGLKIPADRVPFPEFHDRLLSEADVRNMWDEAVAVTAHEILAQHRRGKNE